MGRLLQPALAILTVCGCWKLSSSSSSWKSMMYSFHTAFIILLLHSFTISQFLNVMLNVKTADELSDTLYLCLSSITASCKLLALLINRPNIIMLIEELTQEPNKPRDMEEVNIQQKFDKIIGSTTIQYLVLVESTVVYITLASLVTDFRKKNLVYRAWLPYDYSPTNIYYLTYLHQTLGLLLNSLLNVACDCIIFGLLVHINAQLVTLEHRLKKITPETKDDIKKCVQYHTYIYRYAHTINEMFKIIIGMQFLSSTLVVCFNLYELTNLEQFSSKYLQIIMYMMCMLTEIFYYCWYGNQLKLQDMSRLLQPALAILTVCGCWKLSSPPSRWKSMMYSFHTVFIILLLHSSTLSQFLNLVLNVNTADELGDSLYLCISSITACCKLLTLLINRPNIKMLTEELTREPNKPRDKEEVNIQQKFDKIIGSTTIQYLILVESTVACMTLASLLTDFKKKNLAYRAWLPYDYSPINIYYLTYLHQTLGLIVNALLNVACDCIIFGLLVHINAQLETLQHRLKKITPKTKDHMKKCVQYHIYIYRYARTFNEKFQIIIGIQFLSSTLVVCFNLYELTNLGQLNPKHLQIITYMICMLTQIFYYCWYGNQLKLQEMGRLLQPALAILTVCGCWKPSSFVSSWKSMMYSFHTTFILLVLHSFALSQFLNLVLSVQTANELSDSLYLCIASIMACCKLLTLLINRPNIKMLTEELTREPNKPRDMEEVNIQQKFDKIIGSSTIKYLVLVESTVVCMIFTSLLTDFRKKNLAYRAWLPYDYSPTNIYYLTYLHQTLGLIVTSLLNVACDSIIFGLLVHTNARLKTLGHRLKQITPETKDDVKKCVQYHIYIYRYARMINEKFQIIIGIQFLSSTLVVCFNLYELANLGPLSLKYLEIITYMICMLTQIFYYCWYGNQLKLQSIELIYTPFKIDWTILDISTQRSLLMIMKRATNPIEFTSLFVITMDLQTFVSILKLSYSSYNLLQRTGTS